MANIREAKKSDADKINETAEKAWEEAYEDIVSEEIIETVIEKWYKIEDLKQQTEDPLFYVATEEKRLIGFIHASFESDSSKIVKLHRLYLDPEYWRNGIGSSLLDKVEDEVDEVSKIELEVLDKNKVGKGFYKSKGFEVREKEQVKLFGEPVRQVIMEKEL